MRVFIDTSFYIALLEPRDQWHRFAVQALHPDVTPITSAMIVNETISLLQARGFFSTALEFLDKTRSNHRLQIVYVDATVQAEAWDLFGQWGGAGANAVDCVSFAIMKRFGIRKAFTFDDHFRKAGFQILKP